jgi:hypothetical protein
VTNDQLPKNIFPPTPRFKTHHDKEEKPQDFDTRRRRTSCPSHKNPRPNERRQPEIDTERNLLMKRRNRRNK